METKWEYSIQIHGHDARIYADGQARYGTTWSLARNCDSAAGPYTESIMTSPEVFDDAEAAKRDAVEKLSILRCPIETPIDRALHWMLSEG